MRNFTKTSLKLARQRSCFNVTHNMASIRTSRFYLIPWRLNSHENYSHAGQIVCLSWSETLFSSRIALCSSWSTMKLMKFMLQSPKSQRGLWNNFFNEWIRTCSNSNFICSQNSPVIAQISKPSFIGQTPNSMALLSWPESIRSLHIGRWVFESIVASCDISVHVSIPKKCLLQTTHVNICVTCNSHSSGIFSTKNLFQNKRWIFFIPGMK